jgi:hypothetical protein
MDQLILTVAAPPTTTTHSQRVAAEHFASGNQLQTALPKDIVPGDTVTIPAQLKTPIQSDSGNKRTDYVLSWDLYNKTTGQWLSASDGIGSAAHVGLGDFSWVRRPPRTR